MTEDKPTLGDELGEQIDDKSRRMAMRRVVQVAKHGKCTAPPAPDITIEQSNSFQELARNLERKANEFAARGKQSLDARTVQYLEGGADPKTDELNYGLLETNNRIIASVIRRILGQ